MHKGEEIKTETGLAIGKIVPVQYGKAILSGQIAGIGKCNQYTEHNSAYIGYYIHFNYRK